MPLPYNQCMTPQERVVNLAVLLARKDLKKFAFSNNELLRYIPSATYLLKKQDFFILPYMEQMLTSRCTLHCRYCANLMQYYHKEQHLDWTLEECISNLDRLLECVDYIVWFRLLGGEPLLLPWLPKLIRHALAQEKIGRVEVVTNGTIVPPQELLEVMNNPRASFDFSNYGNVSRHLSEILPIIRQHGIHYAMQHDYTWEDMGDMRIRGYSEDRVREVYAKCDNICKNLVGTEVHICPRSSNGMALGLIPRQANDYVDISAHDTATVHQELRALFDVDHIEACRYCNATEMRTVIPAGEQMPANTVPEN